MCGCTELRSTSCPESGKLLSLHYIQKMPEQVKKLTVSKINKTRQGTTCGKLWEPSSETCICNMHYKDYKGLTRLNNTVVPCYFKQPHEFYSQKVPERRSLIRNPTLEQAQPSAGSCSVDGGSYDASVLPLVCNASTQCDDLAVEYSTLKEELVLMKHEVQRLQTTLQKLDPSILSSAQLCMYTGLNQDEFRILVTWLTGTSIGRHSLSPDDPCILTFSQKVLMVLMRIKQNLTQGDLACQFCVEQSNVSRIISHWVPMLAAVLSDLIKWPQTIIGPSHPPYNFLPNSVAIIDGTEIFIQRPSNLTTQKSSYSDYKSHTTVNYLVPIDTFTGVFSIPWFFWQFK